MTDVNSDRGEDVNLEDDTALMAVILEVYKIPVDFPFCFAPKDPECCVIPLMADGNNDIDGGVLDSGTN